MMVTAFRCSTPGWSAGGTAPAGGSAAMAVPPLMPAPPASLVGLGRCGLQLLGDAVDVARVLDEVLEDLPLALADGGAERGGLEVGHIELRDRRLGQRLGH